MAEPSDSPIASPDVIRVAASLLFTRLFNWVLLRCSLCPDLYEARSFEISADSTPPHSDVYSYNFPKDPRPVKFLAYFVFVLESAQTALTGADIYYWFVAGFGNVERLRNSYFAPIDVPIMTAVSSLIVQGILCYRIWILMNRRTSSWICWIIAVAAATQAAAATWLGIASLTVKKFAVSKTAVYLWSIPSAMADVLIAVVMTLLTGEWQVLQLRINSRDNDLLLRQTQLTAVTTLVLYVAFPNELYYAYSVGILGKTVLQHSLSEPQHRI
ncbi:hypothetical protein EDB84DRAFT_1560392 [Lactarius hengduanensis]|nr:hypothetical protein EDB84DRAFT_1560392 [Lactarius hengduanensis]